MPSATRVQERFTYWKEHVHCYRTSGQSKAQYCRDNDLVYHQFVYWASKFSDVTTPGTTESAPVTSKKLVPVMLTEPAHTTGLQLHLPNGVLISGICTQSVGMVGRLIEQL